MKYGNGVKSFLFFIFLIKSPLRNHEYALEEYLHICVYWLQLPRLSYC